MRFGYRTLDFVSWKIEDAITRIAELGYEGIELCLEHPDLAPRNLTPSRVRYLLSLLQDYGLELTALSYQGLNDQLEIRRRNTQIAIEIASAFRAPVLIIASRRAEPPRLRAQWDELVMWYQQLCRQAEASGLRIAVEAIPDMVVHRTEDLCRMVHDVQHPLFAVNFDIGHAALTDDDLSWAIYSLSQWLVHVHLDDVRSQQEHHLIPGEGQVNWTELKEAFESIGYRGPFVFDVRQGGNSPEERAARCLEAIRQLWSETVPA